VYIGFLREFEPVIRRITNRAIFPFLKSASAIRAMLVLLYLMGSCRRRRRETKEVVVVWQSGFFEGRAGWICVLLL